MFLSDISSAQRTRENVNIFFFKKPPTANAKVMATRSLCLGRFKTNTAFGRFHVSIQTNLAFLGIIG
jgi:hypothetical protein